MGRLSWQAELKRQDEHSTAHAADQAQLNMQQAQEKRRAQNSAPHAADQAQETRQPHHTSRGVSADSA